jgi:hypothetical protein
MTSVSVEDALNRLYFGKDDAESDISAAGLLRESFVPTATYRAVLDGQKTLVIGRKGAGKSAIAVTLFSYPPEGFDVSLITPDEISAEELRSFELPGITPEQAKALVWRYVFAVQVAKFVVSHASHHDGQIPDSVKRLRKFLIDNGESSDLRVHEKFWKLVARLKASFTLEAFGIKVGAEVGPSQGIRAHSQLDLLEEKIAACQRDLACDRSHRRLLLLVDQIEKIWINDRESDTMVTGLLLAAKHTAAAFGATQCITLLREDIYDLVQFADRDKFRGDETAIRWTKDTLLELIVRRVRVSVGADLGETDVWGKLFPRQVDDVDVRWYLVSRTLMRPRELIQLCNLCRDTAIKNGNSTISATDILEAEVQYSSWKLQDLIAEYRVNYPFLADLFVIFQSSAYLITRLALQQRITRVAEALASRYPQFSSVFNLDDALHLLYGIGFLGVLRDGVSRYSYDDPVQLQPEDSGFVIHPSFRQALRSTSSLDIRPYDSQLAERFVGHWRRGLRIGRQFRPLLDVRGGFSGIKELTSVVHRLSVRVGELSFSDELKRELSANLRAILEDLHAWEPSSDAASLFRIVDEMSGALSRMADRLRDISDVDSAGRALAREFELAAARATETLYYL